MRFTFWGTRGSIPVPGPDTLRYGGNSTCCHLEIEGSQVIIDAGSGVRPLGLELAGRASEIILLMTHLHYDHVMGFPFFAPAYVPGTVIRVGGWPKALEGLEGMFRHGRFDGNFPVAFTELAARISYDQALAPPAFSINGVEVASIALNHPQGSIGLRFDGPGGRLVFITDNELEPGFDPPQGLVEFCRGAKVLIHDGQYLPEEMEIRRGWGHSDWRSTLRLARLAGARRLVLTHHEPVRSDHEIEQLIQAAQQEAGDISVEAAWEGLQLEV